MKVAVFAYHDIGYECLDCLIQAGIEIVAVVTHDDDPREEIWFRSVADLAAAESVSRDIIEQALREGQQRGLITIREMAELRRQGHSQKWFVELLAENKQ